MRNTMKKTVKYSLLLITIIMMLFTVNAETLAAEEFTEGFYTYTVTDEKATIVDVDKSISGDVIIPSTLGGYPVTAIGYGAFVECIYITSVTIPEGVTNIGPLCFNCCIKLKNVLLPNSLELIASGAFASCFSLERITLPENVIEVTSGAFINCISLNEFVVCNSAASLGDYVGYTEAMPKDILTKQWLEKVIAFFEADMNGDENAAELEEDVMLYTEFAEEPFVVPSLTIYSHDPSTAKTYADENGIPFKNISELEETFTEGYYTYTVTDGEATIVDVDKSISGDVIIPSTLGGYPVVAIGDEAFMDCGYMTGVTIPEGVTFIGERAFMNCINITKISLPDTLNFIDDIAFGYCVSLTKIIVPDTVNYIGSGTFLGCFLLKEFNVPENIEYISEGTFMYCFSLEKLIINNAQTNFESYYICFTDHKLVNMTVDELVEKVKELYMLLASGNSEAADELSNEIIENHYIFTESVELLKNVTIYSHDPSTAKTYAEENGIPFKNISELEEPHTCTFGEWFTETEPTVFSEGVLKRECECGKFETKPIAKLESAIAKDETTKVEVTYTEENFESEVEVIVSEEEVNANIVFGDEYENFKAYDISLVADGEKVQPNGYVTVKLPIPEGFNEEATVVYYVAPDGTRTKLESTTENGYVIFETNHFSEYVLVDESSKIEPPHEHSYTTSITKEATCTENGITTYTCSCGDSYSETIEATGHDFDGSACKNCDYDKAENCSCNCHKGGIMGFFWKIINFFNKLFKSKQICACGAKHW